MSLPAVSTTSNLASSNNSTPAGSDAGSYSRSTASSSADPGYFAQHGVTPGPKDDFNSLFNRLAIKEGLSKSQRKKRRHEAIAGEIDAIYGRDTSKLEKWQELCRDVKIEPVPSSITQCKKVCKAYSTG